MAELGDFLVSGDTTVNIDVEMLDYGYIGKCDDSATLRGIIDTLKSGKEGLYPELCQAAEDRLFAIIPAKERQKIMRLKHQTTPDQVNDAEQDLGVWLKEVVVVDKELRSSEGIAPEGARKLPPVRGQTHEVRERLDGSPSLPLAPKTVVGAQIGGQKTERLSGYDFHAWEKFNVDEALASLEEEDSQLEKEATKIRLQKKRAAEEAARKREERHAKALDVLRSEMNISALTSVQRKARAVREKQKGNESFRSGENEEAFTYYSRSLALDDAVPAVYSNRALVCLRTDKLDTAEDDCSRALFLDPGFSKARARRGIARLKSGKYDLAIVDFEHALELDDANKELVSLLQKAKDKYLEVEGREYVSAKERQRLDAAMQKAISAGLPVRVIASSSAHALLLPVTGADFDLFSSGTCEIIDNPSDRLTRIVIEDDSSDEEEEQEQFTRLQIDDDDDNSDHEKEEEQQEHREPSGFVRIAIADDDSDSESEGDGDNVEQAHSEPDITISNNLVVAENLKTLANNAMQAGDLEEAIRLYTECVAIDSTSPIAIAAYGNRSLAHLKLEQFSQVLEDTHVVLAHDPGNLKALYRRALALEATQDLVGASRDLDAILSIQSQNQLALEARKRLLSRLEATSAKTLPVAQVQEPACEVTSVEQNRSDIEESNEFKNQGNEAMKMGSNDKAIELYTRAIACDPTNILFYNNRAQAYIKSAQFDLAEIDASHVIQHTGDDSPNFKAYYRRALARKGVCTPESLAGALRDVSFILSHEPDNKAAMLEKQKIESLIKSQSNKMQQKVVEQEVASPKSLNARDSKASGLTEVSSKKKIRVEVHDEAPSPTIPAPALPRESVEPATEKLASSSSKTRAPKDIAVKNLSAPENPPKTVYEFERIWRGLKNRPDLFAAYLKCFKKSTFKKVLKDTCSPDLISSLLVSVRHHLLGSSGSQGGSEEEDVLAGVAVLEGLAGIPKYDMVLFVLPSSDLACLQACVECVAGKLGQSKADVLRQKLKL